MDEVRPRGRFKTVAAWILFPIALATLLALGTWQVQRLHWKEGLIASIETRRHATPASTADILAMVEAGEPVDYRAATASGHYLNDKERHFFATDDGRTGYYVYTPMMLANGSYLFVNRGFVPYELKEAETRPDGLLQGEQTVSGLARDKLTEKPGSLVPDNDLAKDIFYWKDLDAMARTVDLPEDKVLPFFLDADATPVPGGWPKGGVTQISLPNNHLQYAITWYGLAAALVVVAGMAYFRRKS